MIPNALWPAVQAILWLVAAWTLVAVIFVILLIIPFMVLGGIALALCGFGRRARRLSSAPDRMRPGETTQ